MTVPKFSPEALAGIADQLHNAEQELVRLRDALSEVKRIANTNPSGAWHVAKNALAQTPSTASGIKTADGFPVEEYLRICRALAVEGAERAYAMADDVPHDSALMAKLAFRLDQLCDAAALTESPK